MRWSASVLLIGLFALDSASTAAPGVRGALLCHRDPLKVASMQASTVGDAAAAASEVCFVQTSAPSTVRLRVWPSRTRSFACAIEAPCDETEVDVTARRSGSGERPATPIPFGLQAILWAARHPDRAWRIVLPVLA